MNRGARLRRSQSLTTPCGAEAEQPGYGPMEEPRPGPSGCGAMEDVSPRMRPPQDALKASKRRHKSLDWNHFNYPFANEVSARLCLESKH